MKLEIPKTAIIVFLTIHVTAKFIYLIHVWIMDQKLIVKRQLEETIH